LKHASRMRTIPLALSATWEMSGLTKENMRLIL
jgi:hypothetical protein